MEKKLSDMMITHTNNGSTWLLVQVPEGAKNFRIVNGAYIKRLKCDDGLIDWFPDSAPLRIVGLASELTEEQWKEIVENIRVSPIGVPTTYKNYKDNRHYCDTGKESGLSILRSHGLNEKTTLIIKKQ